LFRETRDEEAVREMNEMTKMGEDYFAESGKTIQLVGVLRAMDIKYNPRKR
jgi:hypothetical protein